MWSVIYNVTSPHWSREDIVYLFRIEIFLLSIQDEIVSFGPQIRCNSSAKKNKCENIAVLANVMS